MPDFTELIEITKNILINNGLICEYLQTQNHNFAAKKIKENISLLGKFIDKSIDIVSADILNELVAILQEIAATQEQKNYVLLSDLFELKLHPLMSDIQKQFVGNSDICETSLPKDYSIEFTNIGASTISINGIYLHSNGDPYKEARLFAREYCERDTTNYTVFGIGLGYHIIAMLELDPRYSLTVLEPDSHVLDIAQKYNDFDKYTCNGRLKIQAIDAHYNVAPYYTPGQHKFIIHYPTLLLMKDSPYKKQLTDYFMSLSSIQAHIKYLNANFYYNRKLNDSSIDTIEHAFSNKTVIYAGGGPSLQMRLDELKNLTQDLDTVLVCAGTVYTKLLSQNVIPDYVIITDPAEILENQLKDAPETKTALLYLSTASKEAVSIFKGKRYIIYQNGYKDAEELAKANHYTTFETGGSVSTTAIDIALRFNCKKLICIGLDLAFTGNERHAFGIGGSVTSSEGLIQVEAVDGGMIDTSNNLNIYRKWIEQRIKNINTIPIINMSRGAKIHGMIDM